MSHSQTCLIPPKMRDFRDMNILVVEDQPQMKAYLTESLNGAGYQAHGVETSADALASITSRACDFVVLDIMLPDEDGFVTAKKIRSAGFKGPLLMLTALNSTRDKINGLDSGADDYLTKPFEVSEFLARVRALSRRTSAQTSPAEKTNFKYKGVELDLITRKATRGGKPLSLTQKEFSLLELLIRTPEETVKRELISKQIWEAEYNPESNVIDVCVNTLRKKLDQGFEKRIVHTVIGIGYTLKED